ncbi:MAG TPA: hypothetical protein VFX79_02230 [Candidatus Saccharimonadales bacterium]|nr:hypothetical protein [Candidatus Saccharimonadales bacterium]
MVIKNKISQILSNKKAKILALVIVLALAGLAAYYLYDKESSKPSREEIIKISDEAANLMAEDNYSGANEKLINIYNLEEDEAEKAYRAFDIGNNYQFELNYDEAIKWFNVAKGHYESVEDQDGADQANQAIESAKKFKTQQNQPVRKSPVDKGV